MAPFPEFPALSASDITSPATPEYNCIAWSAQDVNRWWWPDPMFVAYWPDGAPREETIDAFVAVYQNLGYTECDSAAPENGYVKIALYALGGKLKHAARQLANGRWTSKLGRSEDVQHELKDLEGSTYGAVVKLFRRRRQL